MFRTLSLRAKILALPVVAAVGFLTTLGTTFVLGSRSQAQLERLEMQESPAFETSQKLQSQLEVYQRALRDAVGASDTSAVVAADSIAKTFLALSESLAKNGSVDSTAVQALAACRIEHCHAIADVMNGLLADQALELLARCLSGRDTKKVL